MKTHALIASAAISTLIGGAQAEEIEIAQVGFAFSPAEVTAAPGDTLRFTWGQGSHTVTSGFNCTASDIDGFFFDEPLT
ncbi:MAG: hypothetical protein MK085_10945, partial [Phycisphaerales bacterium]|nr:hypothetical protein [Phycisphaerales bacterium]